MVLSTADKVASSRNQALKLGRHTTCGPALFESIDAPLRKIIKTRGTSQAPRRCG
jgi:hypothetical protein